MPAVVPVPVEQDTAPPVLAVHGLGLRTSRGWRYRGLDLEIRTGQLIGLTGASGSGRTSALLALADRFVTSEGTRQATGRAVLALVPGVNEPEPALTVAEHVGERMRLLGLARPWHRTPRGESGTLVRELSPLERHRLMLRLALIEQPDLLLVDDIDVGLTPAETRLLCADFAATGCAVVAVCRDAGVLGLPFTTSIEVTR